MGTSQPDPLRERIADAALRAELMAGLESPETARRHVLIRMSRVVVGFLLVVAGIGLLPLPGPGWLVVIAGLAMLPYAWAERTIVLIRSKIPGIPEQGAIPLHTWIIMVVLTVAFTAISVFWGDDVKAMAEGLFTR